MAIMTRCCCCDVRVGSIVVAIWTMISTVISLIQSSRAVALYGGFEELVSYGPYMAVWGTSIGLNSILLIAAIALLFGVTKDKKELLIPYVVCESLLLLGYLALEIALIIALANNSYLSFDFLDMNIPSTFDESVYESAEAIALKMVFIIFAVVVPIVMAIEILCLLCVISQYQELRDGRGRRECLPGQTLIIQQTGYTTGFAPATYDPKPACPPPPQQYHTTPHAKC